MTEDHHLPPVPCPSCGERLDTATPMFADGVPVDGDITICLKCGHIMVFEDQRPRNPTDAEMRRMAGDRRIIKVQKARGKLTK